jgi:uncharacterized protein
MNIKPRLLTAFLLSCLALPQLGAQQAAAPVRKGLFWKATSESNTVYLLGSIHLGSKDMYPLPKEFEDAFAASRTLLVEVDLNKVDMQQMQAMVMGKGMYAGDDELWNHVSADTRKRVEQFCEKYQLPAAAVAKMKPWLVGITVATIPMMKMGMDPGLGIDKYFLDKAKEKNVVEIESAEWQVNLLSGFSDELQGKFLASAVDQAEKSIDHGRKIQDLWMRGDAAKVEEELSRDEGPPEIAKALLHDRNPHMADVAEQYLKGKDPAFVVVGAAHMVGKDGIVSLLEKRGYKVQQVTLAR